MGFTADMTENEKTLLPSLLNIFSMFKICCWYNQGEDDQNTLENIAIRRGKETMIYMEK